jgi:hypothetical protein
MSRYPARISLGERMRKTWLPSLKLKEDLRTLAQLLKALRTPLRAKQHQAARGRRVLPWVRTVSCWENENEWRGSIQTEIRAIGRSVYGGDRDFRKEKREQHHAGKHAEKIWSCHCQLSIQRA